jgi:hypothetical protein
VRLTIDLSARIAFTSSDVGLVAAQTKLVIGLLTTNVSSGLETRAISDRQSVQRCVHFDSVLYSGYLDCSSIFFKDGYSSFFNNILVYNCCTIA